MRSGSRFETQNITEVKPDESNHDMADHDHKSSLTQRFDEQNKSVYYSNYHNSSLIKDIDNNLNQNIHKHDMSTASDKNDKSNEKLF